jgi:hypothetical protein
MWVDLYRNMAGGAKQVAILNGKKATKENFLSICIKQPNRFLRGEFWSYAIYDKLPFVVSFIWEE